MNTVFVVFALFLAAVATGEAEPSLSATAHHAMHLIKLPNGDYTVPMSELRNSGTTGKVTLHPEGARTLVRISVNGRDLRKHAFNLHAGKDCETLGASNMIPLVPAMTGQPSQTLVSLPIGNFTSKDYVVDAQDANARQAYREACARF